MDLLSANFSLVLPTVVCASMRLSCTGCTSEQIGRSYHYLTTYLSVLILLVTISGVKMVLIFLDLFSQCGLFAVDTLGILAKYYTFSGRMTPTG